MIRAANFGLNLSTQNASMWSKCIKSQGKNGKSFLHCFQRKGHSKGLDCARDSGTLLMVFSKNLRKMYCEAFGIKRVVFVSFWAALAGSLLWNFIFWKVKVSTQLFFQNFFKALQRRSKVLPNDCVFVHIKYTRSQPSSTATGEEVTAFSVGKWEENWSFRSYIDTIFLCPKENG